MIVHCPRCQARFRVADEKVGPRGSRVRCSRCTDVFVVRREEEAAPTAPGIELVERTPGLPQPAPPADPFAAAGPEALSAVSTRKVPPAAADPFAAEFDALGAPGEPAPSQNDPFAQAAAPAAPPDGDPFAGVTDRFGLPPPAAGATALPVTDLAQLMGTGAPESAPSAPAPSLAELEAAPAAPVFPDLTLEERGTPSPVPFADPADVLAATPGPSAFDGAAFEAGPAGPLVQVPLGEESLALATEPNWSPPEVARGGPEPGQGAEAAPAAEAAALAAQRPQPRAVKPAEELATPAPPVPGGATRLRAAAFDALALVVLLAVALAFRVAWRGEALGPGAFRPSALLHGISAEQAPQGPFQVDEVRSSLYEQAGGGAVLFVRGQVISRAPAPAAAVHVVAELVRGGRVLARGEALAGGVPTAEEVYQASDRAALDKLSAELRTRAPRQVAPGDRLGFVVVLGDAPADVAGASVRVRADAGGAEAAAR